MQDLYIPGISYQVLATINLGLWLVFEFFFFGGVGGGGGECEASKCINDEKPKQLESIRPYVWF